MQILIAILYAGLFTWIISWMKIFRMSGIPVTRIWFFWGLKLLAGAGLYLVYTRYYPDRSTSDLFKYFDDSAEIWKVASKSSLTYLKMLLGIGDDSNLALEAYANMQNWERRYETGIFNDAHTMIRLNALLRIFSFGSIYAHIVIMSFLAFTGLIALYNFMQRYAPGRQMILQFMLFMMPSLVFWSSGPMKEAVVIIGMGLIAYALPFHWKWRSGLAGIVGMFLMVLAKVYLLVPLLPAIGGWMLSGIPFMKKRVFMAYGLVVLAAAGTVYTAGLLNKDYILPEMLHMRQRDFRNVAMGGVYMQNDTMTVYVPDEFREELFVGKYAVSMPDGFEFQYWKNVGNRDTLTGSASSLDTLPKIYDNVRSGSMIATPDLGQGWGGLLISAPHAFYNALIAPMQLPPNSAMLAISFVEKVAFFLLWGLALVYWIRSKPTQNKRFLLFVVTFTVILFVLIGWITPVAGALVRYQVPALPLMIGALAMLFPTDPLQKLVIQWKKALLR